MSVAVGKTDTLHFVKGIGMSEPNTVVASLIDGSGNHVPEVEVTRPSEEAVAKWKASGREIEIALGSENDFLQSLSKSTIETLTYCSENGSLTSAYAELLREGVLLDARPQTVFAKEWLEERYLGTWESKSSALGAFFRDLGKLCLMDDEDRNSSYERLTKLFGIHEHTLTTGRVVVSLQYSISSGERALATDRLF